LILLILFISLFLFLVVNPALTILGWLLSP